MFVIFNCGVFLTFPCGIMGQVWYMIVSISDLCRLYYFQHNNNGGKTWIQVRFSMIFPLILIRFAWSLKQVYIEDVNMNMTSQGIVDMKGCQHSKHISISVFQTERRFKAA